MRLTGDKLFVMWQDSDENGITSVCEYDYLTGTYIVSVYDKHTILSESFQESFSNDYIMNILDAQKSVGIAERLQKKLEDLSAS